MINDLDKMLAKDEKFVPYQARKTMIRLKKQGIAIPKVSKVLFNFGKDTYQNLFDLTFECTDCGCCCKTSEEECENLYFEEDKSRCSIYEERSFGCFTYPFVLDSRFKQFKGEYRKYSNKEEYIFGIIPGVLSLVIDDLCPGHGKGTKKLREYLLEISDKTLELKDIQDIPTPLDSLSEVFYPDSDVEVKDPKIKAEADIKFHNIILKRKSEFPRFMRALKV